MIGGGGHGHLAESQNWADAQHGAPPQRFTRRAITLLVLAFVGPTVVLAILALVVL